MPTGITASTTSVTSETSSHQTFTPELTPGSTPRPEARNSAVIGLPFIQDSVEMDEARTDRKGEEEKATQTQQIEGDKSQATASKTTNKKKKCCTKHKRCKKCKSKKEKKGESDLSSSSDSSSSSSDSDSDSSDSSASSAKSSSSRSSSSSSSSESEDEKSAKKSKKNKKKSEKKTSKKSKRRSKSDSSDEDEAGDEAESSSDEDNKSSKRKKKSKKSTKTEEAKETAAEPEDTSELSKKVTATIQEALEGVVEEILKRNAKDSSSSSKKGRKSKKSKRGKSASYYRADQVWDRELYDWKLRPSAEADKDETIGEHIFHVRRCFDWENKYTETLVDIKSKSLRNALRIVMKNCRAVSLAEDEPAIDPNMLFLYHVDLVNYRKELKRKLANERKKKTKKQLKQQIAQLKTLIKYIEKDYAKTSRTLYPMLAKGDITFDLLWCLFRSDEICYTTTYGAVDEPRAYKVTVASKEHSFVRGTWYQVDGDYLEFNGKEFGLGNMSVEVDSFKGPRKINTLPCYPLKYHKDAEALKTRLITRGKKFVSLAGLQYKFHKGLGFVKRKRQVVKVSTNGRVMLAPADFRQINPNYPISTVRATDPNLLGSDDEGSDDEGGCCCGSDGEDSKENALIKAADDSPKFRNKLVKDPDGCFQIVQVEVDEDGQEVQKEKLENIEQGFEVQRTFTDEELLIASPVVLGFAFSEKLWLEFTVDGVRDIEFNEFAFESLVLPEKQKGIVKALVESHTSENSERKNIDDVIQGKGRGLVAILHGPPGVGKTLTAESIAELLQRPLYMVSAGELGTNPRELESFLQQILDLANRWQAVLLLDEADVFLEARTSQDIHRNALVSIFLRLLEYFQGILFLTTNRVATFDEAFQSRIHIALRYNELDFKARRSIFAMFLNKVAALPINQEKIAVNVPEETSASDIPGSGKPRRDYASGSSKKSDNTVEVVKCVHPNFSSDDLDRLARASLNGRQIKNVVRSAQALAVNENKEIQLRHIIQVLEVAEAFDRDLKGGSGYTDAMRSYM